MARFGTALIALLVAVGGAGLKSGPTYASAVTHASAATYARAATEQARALGWYDLPAPTQRRLSAAGIDAGSFQAFCRDRDRETQARVREGDLDALVYYALQSTAFTQDQPLEPALSAKAFVDSLDAPTRTAFLSGTGAPIERVPLAAHRRLTALAAALRNPPADRRLAYFRDIVRSEKSATGRTDAFMLEQYVRAMRFLYNKEFAVRDRPDASEAIALLYRTRGLSTDTAVEAGYLVQLGLATLRESEPARRVRRVLIVGPGLDLAPRTGLLEAGSPESYQPYAVIDTLVALGLAIPTSDDLVVIGADVNDRVVDHLERNRGKDVVLRLVTGIGDSDTVTLDDGYRRYFETIGGSVAQSMPEPALAAGSRGHLRKSIRIPAAISRLVRGAELNIITARLGTEPFDLVIATNVFPYLDDTSLVVAFGNIAAMLAPGGVLVHNEARPLAGDLASELGLPTLHSRTVILATVRGAPAPLYDSVFVHVRRRAG